jgi:hypothetical protein
VIFDYFDLGGKPGVMAGLPLNESASSGFFNMLDRSGSACGAG